MTARAFEPDQVCIDKASVPHLRALLHDPDIFNKYRRGTATEPVIEGFGPVRQMGHVVDDIDAWIDALSREQGIGPWMVMRNVGLPCTFRGEKSKPVIHVALSYVGDMQIELIQQLNDAPSPYRETIATGAYGLHHTAHLRDNIHRDIERAGEQGYELVCDIRMLGSRYAYLQSATPGEGVYVEFLPASFMMKTMFRQGIAASKRWQGSGEAINIDLSHPGTIIASLPSAARAWWSQR